jgi:hypothetical protein
MGIIHNPVAMFKSSWLPLLLLFSPGLNAKEGAIFARQENGIIHLHSDGSGSAQFIIDHGHDVNGYTTYHVVNASGDTSGFTIAHIEARALLNQDQVHLREWSSMYRSSQSKSRAMDRSLCLPSSKPIEFNITENLQSTPPTPAAFCRAVFDGSCSRCLRPAI